MISRVFVSKRNEKVKRVCRRSFQSWRQRSEMSCSNKIKIVLWVQSWLEITSRLCFIIGNNFYSCVVRWEFYAQLWMSLAWGDRQLCLKCCHSSLAKRERRTQSPASCKLSSVWAWLCGKGLCRSAAKGRGCARGACAAARDSLCFQKVASICMAAMGEGKPADPSVFSCCSWGWYPFAKQALLVVCWVSAYSFELRLEACWGFSPDSRMSSTVGLLFSKHLKDILF